MAHELGENMTDVELEELVAEVREVEGSSQSLCILPARADFLRVWCRLGGIRMVRSTRMNL